MRKRILKTPRMPNYRHQMINEAASAHDSLDFYHDKLIPHLDSIINVDRIIRNANKWTKDKKQIHIIQEIVNMNLFTESSMNAFNNDKDASCISHSVDGGEYSYTLRTSDDFIDEEIQDAPERDVNKMIADIKIAIKNKELEKAVVIFGAIVRESFEFHEFTIMFLSTTHSIISNTNILDEGYQNYRGKVISLYMSVMS